jgi:hypothetical protein
MSKQRKPDEFKASRKRLETDLAAGAEELPLRCFTEFLDASETAIIRWIISGQSCGTGERVYLDGRQIGRWWYTTEAAVRRFLLDLGREDERPVGEPPSPVPSGVRAGDRPRGQFADVTERGRLSYPT